MSPQIIYPSFAKSSAPGNEILLVNARITEHVGVCCGNPESFPDSPLRTPHLLEKPSLPLSISTTIHGLRNLVPRPHTLSCPNQSRAEAAETTFEPFKMNRICGAGAERTFYTLQPSPWLPRTLYLMHI